MGTADKKVDPVTNRPQIVGRATPRANCSIPADLLFNGVLLCSGIIKDISVDGVRLFVPNKKWLPHEFEIKADVFDRSIKVRTRWSGKEYVGARFLFNQNE